MGNAIKIDTTSLTRQSNANHLRIHQRIYGNIHEYVEDTRTKLGLTDALLESYDASIQQEIEITERTTKYVESQKLKLCNRERLRLCSKIFFDSKSGTKAIDEEMREAAEEVDAVVNTYRNIRKVKDEEKTGKIEGLLHDLQKDEMQGFIEKLKLTDTLAELEKMNEKYQLLLTTRQNKQKASKMPPASEIRKKTDEILVHIGDLLTSAQLNLTEEEEEALAVAICIVEDINLIILEYKHSLKQSQAIRKAFAVREERRKQEAAEEAGIEYVSPEERKIQKRIDAGKKKIQELEALAEYYAELYKIGEDEKPNKEKISEMSKDN